MPMKWIPRNISLWSNIAFSLAFVSNVLVILFYPFETGTKVLRESSIIFCKTVYVFACLCIYLCVCMFVFGCIFACLCCFNICACVHVCIIIYLYVSLFACVFTCTCMFECWITCNSTVEL